MNTLSAPLGTLVLNVGAASRIPLGEGRTMRVGEHRIAVFRPRTGGVFVTEASCSHKAGPLADGLLGARRVICPLHGCEFDLETGQASGDACRKLKVYPALINAQGEILIGID